MCAALGQLPADLECLLQRGAVHGADDDRRRAANRQELLLMELVRRLDRNADPRCLVGFTRSPKGGNDPLLQVVSDRYQRWLEDAGARIMGTMFGAVNMASTLGMALDPWAGGWLYDAYASYFWLYIGSFGIGLGAVAIALTFRPPRELSVALPSPSIA